MSRWPADNQSALISFYGNPGSSGPNGVAAQLVKVHAPFQMYYDGKPINTVSFHRKAAPALMAALNDIWDACGQDQSKLDKLGVSSTGGTYNPRKVRGSATKWSNHAFGAAIDLDPDHNGFNTGRGKMPQFVIDAFDKQGFRWGGRYKSRTDPMHFEACDPGDDAAPVGLMDLPQADGHDTESPAEVPTPDVNPPPAPAKVITARTAAATGAGVLGIGQTVSAIVGPPNEIADKVTSIVDKSGNVIDTTKQIVAVPKPGFWNGVLHVITSPEFVVGIVVLIVVMWALVWFWQHNHKPPESS
jgi:hypothetical protein